MPICPVCNGLREVFLLCTNCGEPMMEAGRLMDFYENYSPYMEIDLVKMEDGYMETNSEQICPHLFYCSKCHYDEVIFIKE